jgi:hypothetical protein
MVLYLGTLCGIGSVYAFWVHIFLASISASGKVGLFNDLQFGQFPFSIEVRIGGLIHSQGEIPTGKGFHEVDGIAVTAEIDDD